MIKIFQSIILIGLITLFSCAKDSDQDGIPDNLDECPNTILGETADAQGCAAYQKDIDITGDPNKLPILVTATSVTNITDSSAICGGDISSDNGSTVTARGVCWSKNINPSIRDGFTKNGSGVGEFVGTLNLLEPNTSYYVRAYATNVNGTAYGSALNFTTLSGLPVVRTYPVTDSTTTSAKCGGIVESEKGSHVISRGVCYSSTYAIPTLSNSMKTVDGVGLGQFTSNLENLAMGKLHHVRAYATNANGTSYGETYSFTTLYSLPLGTFTDSRDGNVYEMLQIGCMSSNQIGLFRSKIKRHFYQLFAIYNLVFNFQYPTVKFISD